LGAHDFFIGEVLAVQVDEEALDTRCQLEHEKAQPLAYGAATTLKSARDWAPTVIGGQ
jgi:flavin reductase (DIM6/NTAB) family NADH-FMN oxidoreductase RutF